jgi:hypothetical protein
VATAESRAEQPRAHLTRRIEDPPPLVGGGRSAEWPPPLARGIALAPVAFPARAVGAGTSAVRGTLGAVGALADRIVMPPPSPYGSQPVWIAIYLSDAPSADDAGAPSGVG